MFSYLAIACMAIYVAVKWLLQHQQKMKTPSPDVMDRELLQLLNPGRDIDAN
ncbi:MAG: hypothetical protein H7X86_06740 [Gorillibacterium sp.]|nr:hypothetical protein [Gorillibacterium sp.]